MLGVPARQTGWVCYCGTALPKRTGDVLVCHDCGRRYREGPQRLQPLEEG